jgi:hypothetical protein
MLVTTSWPLLGPQLHIWHAPRNYRGCLVLLHNGYAVSSVFRQLTFALQADRQGSDPSTSGSPYVSSGFNLLDSLLLLVRNCQALISFTTMGILMTWRPRHSAAFTGTHERHQCPSQRYNYHDVNLGSRPFDLFYSAGQGSVLQRSFITHIRCMDIMIIHESSSKVTQRRIHAALTRFSGKRMRLSPIRLCYALRRIPRNTRAAQSSSLHEAYSGSSNRKSRLTLLQLAAPVDSGTRGKRILWAPRPAHQANRGCIPDT